MAEILVVEDEKDLREVLLYNLRQAGHSLRSTGTGEEAIALSLRSVPDLIILDLMLPDVSGFEVCRKLKQMPATRGVCIIMLTARGEEVDRVVGFELGADDYVVKPFSLRELLLRIDRLLKPKLEQAATRGVMSFGSLRVDPAAHRAWVGEAEVMLTAMEFKLLVTLLSRRDRVQSREQLLTDVWGISAEITTRTVDTHVKRLREKLGTAGAYIETVRGVGYRFAGTPPPKPAGSGDR